MMMKDISILVPTYNYDCTRMVSELRRQADALGINYEIVVADDGSTDALSVEHNRAINQWAHCRLDERPQNTGRAAIRNYLARQARYEWLLFLDSDMQVADSRFVERYLTAGDDDSVVDGGIKVGTPPYPSQNIRYLYEHRCEPRHTADNRQQRPYQSFRTTNFLVRRDVMLKHPFDERFRHYGYEDVLWGRQLERHHLSIRHIDNPMLLTDFETNDVFVGKTEEGLRTLHEFRDELRGYSRLLDRAEALPRQPLRWCYRLFGRLLRRHLTGRHPRLFLFQLYRLCYYASL